MESVLQGPVAPLTSLTRQTLTATVGVPVILTDRTDVADFPGARNPGSQKLPSGLKIAPLPTQLRFSTLALLSDSRTRSSEVETVPVFFSLNTNVTWSPGDAALTPPATLPEMEKDTVAGTTDGCAAAAETAAASTPETPIAPIAPTASTNLRMSLTSR